MRIHALLFSLLFIILGAVAFYPAYMLAVFSLDYAYGSRALWQSLHYESWSHTISLLLSDWSQALPTSAAISGSLLLPELLRGKLVGNTAMLAVYAAFVVAILLVFRVVGFAGAQLIPVAFAALVLAVACCHIFPRFLPTDA